MLVPNRHANTPKYRYGFQGQEMDDGLKGEGNSLNYTYRMHDPRVGRFFARDPLEPTYPFYAPYQFSGNTPIMAVELEGLESSATPNKNEAKEEPSGVRRFFADVVIGWTNILYNINQISNGEAPRSTNQMFADENFGEKVIGGQKNLIDFTFEFMGVMETARFGIGGIDDEVSFGLKFNKGTFNFSLPKLNLPKLNLNFAKYTIFDIRENLARSFFKMYNLPNIERHMKAINFGEQVYTKTLDIGTKLYRYSKKGATDAKHYFTTEPWTLPGAVGKQAARNNPEEYIIEEFTLTKRVKALHSTTDLDGKPGGTQVFSPEIEKNSTVKSANNWPDLLRE